jgi:hypothetical protein
MRYGAGANSGSRKSMNGGRGRSRFGEMVQRDTSEHDWLKGRGENAKLYLIAMIADATSRSVGSFRRE